jgi:hypothetical protein
MSQIETVLVQDNILSCEDKVKYGVFSGGQSITTQQFPATSTSPSQMVFTVQVPSTNVVMDRRLIIRYTATVSGTTATADNGVPLSYGPGGNAVLAPFPLNQNITNVSCQINNTTVSQTTAQVLDPLLRCLEKDVLSEWSGSAPTRLDNACPYTSYGSANTAWPSSAWQSYQGTTDSYCPPRGAYPINIITNTAVEADTAAAPFSFSFSAAEPLMISPFVYGDDSEECAGIYGVSQININMSLDAACKRMLRNSALSAAPIYNGTFTPNSVSVVYSNVSIECRFLSPPASALLPMTNIVPYSSIVNYQTTLNAAVAAAASSNITSSNVQLNAVPDKVFLFIKDSQNNIGYSTPDCYATITNVSITFNNNSGLLSGSSPQSLWRMSREAGCLQSWLEFSGLANSYPVPLVAVNGAMFGTVGSVLVLDFGRHIQLQENWYSPGSLGSFNFQVQIQYTNNTGTSYTNPQLNVAFLSSGVFATTNGQSAAYIGVLNKEEVLKAMEQEPVSQHTLQRLVGGKRGSLFHGLKAMAHRAFRYAKHHPQALGHLKDAIASAHPKAAHAVNALGMLGLGMDGGASSGGRKHRLHHRVL